MKRVLGSIFSVLVLLLGIVPFLAMSTVAAQPSCAPVALVPIRGSGEGRAGSGEGSEGLKYYGSNVSNGYEGPTLAKLLTAFYDQNPSLANTPIIEVDERYPATAVNAGVEAVVPNLQSSPVYSSSQTGVNATIAATSRFRFHDSRGCKSTKFILIGYSQGAMVARDTAMTIPSLIAGVYSVGDPWQKPNASNVTGDGRGGRGVFHTNYPRAGAARDAFYSAAYAKHSLCHAKDPVCDFAGSTWTAFNDGPHLNYFNGSEVNTEASVLARMVSGASTAPPVGTSALNVAFVVDTTGSMSPYIADARANITTISQNVLRTSPNSKFSLVEYKDYGDPFIAKTVVPLTGNAAALDSGIQSLGADGGGDYPESVFSGVVEGVRTLQGAAGTSAVVILRDAPPHDPEPWSGLSSDSLRRILLGVDPVPSAADSAARAINARTIPSEDREQGPGAPVDSAVTRVAPPVALSAPAADEVPSYPSTILYDVNAGGASSDVIGSIVDATGGRNFGIGTPGDVTTSILDAVDDAGEAPAAVLGALPTITAGEETTLSGMASVGVAPLSFEFDFENDGIVDAVNVDGFAGHVFERPGVYTVALTVRDPRGRSSTTSMEVNVVADNENPQVPIDEVPTDPSSPTFGSSGSGDGFTFGS